MGLLDTLRRLGDRLGILELSREAQPSSPVKIQTRSTTLAELIVEIQVTDVQSLAELPAELSVSFEDVFKAAGIPAPPSGWTVERLMEFVQTYKLHSLEHPAAQRAILSELKSQNVAAADLI